MPPKRARESSALGLDETLAFMRDLWAVHHGLQARSKRMAVRVGVTGPQRLVVRMLGTRPGISAGELAELLHVHPSTITGVLRRLESQGIVERHIAANDRRKTQLVLTPKGHTVDELRIGTVEAAVREVLGAASADEIAATRALLGRLATVLGEDPRG
jgi:DNA-binding MarR family transcriptional regulator